MKNFETQNHNVKKCDWCGKPFDLNDGHKHYFDAQLDVWFCSDRCLVNSFMPQLGDSFVRQILCDPEYNVIDHQGTKVGAM